MIGRYETEREGQIEFYNTFLPRIDPTINVNDILSDNNDGVLKGNLLEFKLNVSDLNAHLFQSIKYLSALRCKGKPVPATILIIDLNAGTAWVYKTEPYREHVEKTYFGPASKGNQGFNGGVPDETLKYREKSLDAERLIKILKETNYFKINIDENCIVGWAKTYYSQNPGSRKEDFLGDDTGVHNTIGEIRRPNRLSDYILPYQGKSNVKFSYLMDKLNDDIQKKNLGAFYTPTLYCEKAAELVRKAIERVPAGNDYVIIDRCAGTGNLELGLTRDERSHCIVSTIEYYEYKVLQENIGYEVRHIIPAFESDDTFDRGLVNESDALKASFYQNEVIKQYVDNPKCTIILFENPPYAETTSAEHQRRGAGKESSIWKNSDVVKEMKKEVKGSAVNDLGNAFIWSGFKYCLRQPTDSYVVFSPCKYWKAQHLINKKFIDGFAFNRKHFHTNINACITTILWSNESCQDLEEFELTGYDIDKDGLVLWPEPIKIRKIHGIYSDKYYDKRPIPEEQRVGILVGLGGLEKFDGKHRIKPAYSEDILGYMVVDSSGFDNPDLHSSLLVAGRYNGNGFYLRKDNYLEKMPLFAASRYYNYNRIWIDRARIMKSSDGADKFFKDLSAGVLDQYLLKCLLFTCFEPQNHMRTFKGSDGRLYVNQICLDTTNGPTVASKDLERLKMNEVEERLMEIWGRIISLAKDTEEYNSSINYGLYQIIEEIDTSYVDVISGETVWNHQELHAQIITLKSEIGNYYNNYIKPTLLEYDFLK